MSKLISYFYKNICQRDGYRRKVEEHGGQKKGKPIMLCMMGGDLIAVSTKLLLRF